jgi:anti-sigma factor RsiW
MTCDQTRALLHGYFDDELDLANALQIEQHLSDCADCRSRLDALRALRAALAEPSVSYPAPIALGDQLKRTIADAREKAAPSRLPSSSLSSPSSSPVWWWRTTVPSAWAAGVLLLICCSLLFWPHGGAASDQAIELVGSHIRSLEANHLLDVVSTDQHTVKPWLACKLDFSPPVVDLSGDGFPLIGGRLDFVAQHKVAALIYRRNQHIINLFIRPEENADTSDSREAVNGFNLIGFHDRGMLCWAVSDLNAAELQRFVELFKSQKPASTEPASLR